MGGKLSVKFNDTPPWELYDSSSIKRIIECTFKDGDCSVQFTWKMGWNFCKLTLEDNVSKVTFLNISKNDRYWIDTLIKERFTDGYV